MCKVLPALRTKDQLLVMMFSKVSEFLILNGLNCMISISKANLQCPKVFDIH